MNKDNINHSIETVNDQLNTAIANENSTEFIKARTSIIKLIQNMIFFYFNNGQLGSWEKDYLLRAICALGSNWLLLSIFYIKKSILETQARPPIYSNNDGIGKLTPNILLNELENAKAWAEKKKKFFNS